jgi:phosphoserine phosphatase RsbU/P
VQQVHQLQGLRQTQRCELEPVLASIRALRTFAARRAFDATLGDSDMYLIELAAVEVFTNIIRHAGSLSEDSKIVLISRFFNGHFELEISYRGVPFVPPVPTVRRAPIDDVALARLPERGFGLWIINAACDRVRYSQHDGTNTILISKSPGFAESRGFVKPRGLPESLDLLDSVSL